MGKTSGANLTFLHHVTKMSAIFPLEADLGYLGVV